DQRRLSLDERDGLTLHVRAHQRAVGVIVLEERDERRGHRHELLGRNVDVVDLFLRYEQHVTLIAAGDEIVRQLALGIDLGVGLRNVVAHLLHRRQVDDLVGELAVDDLAVRALDEAVLVDARERRQRVDEADVRTFRRLDRADAAVVRRMHVAHLEAGALARQTARAKCRQAALVGDLRQRVGLVHKLRELRRPEELAHSGGRRLGVDQVLRHDSVDVDRGHALLDGALHAEQADAVLVLHQLADRADAPVAEVIDVVDLPLAVAQVDQRLDDGEDVLAAQYAHGIGRIELEAHVHLHAADGGEVVTLAIEEQRVEQIGRRLDRRRLTRAHDPVNVHQRLFHVGVLVDFERVADEWPNIDVVDVEDREILDLLILQLSQQIRVELIAGFSDDGTSLQVHDVSGDVTAREVVGGDEYLLQSTL